MPKLAFSDAVVRNLSSPTKGQVRYWDQSLAGFGLRVSQGGAKTWVVLDPRAKVRVAETIGRYPTISLQDARGEAKRLLAENTLGRHKPRSIGYEMARDAYLQETKRKRKARTYLDYERVLKKAKFGRLADVSPDEVYKQLARTGEQGFAILRAFFNWAYTKHYVDESPMERMKASAYKSRERVLTDEELAKVWHAAGDDTHGRIVRLLILTGQRRGEISGLAPSMVGADRITLPPELTKNGREHAFPLGAEAQKCLVFPFSWGGWSKSKRALDKRSGVKGWVLHDLRRTFRSNLGKLGVRPDIAERVVNHVSARSEMDRTYDRYDYLPEMREAMLKWEAHVLALVSRDAHDPELVARTAEAA